MKAESYVMPLDGGRLQADSYYYSQFGTIPNELLDSSRYGIDAIDIITNHYKDDADFSTISYQRLNEDGKSVELERQYITLSNNAIVVACRICEDSRDCSLILYHSNNKAVVDEYLKLIRPYRMPKTTVPEFSVISLDNGRLSTTPFTIRDIEVDIDLHYNDDFAAVDKRINSFLKEDRSGLIILHGKQGTGKTTYIRNIIKNTKKDVIYIGSDMAHSIATPQFVPFILDNAYSVIILEDCEELLSSRKGGQGINSGLVNILNMSDGLLGDALKMKFICTFNAPLNDIDKALLRKGRLVARYEFGDLTPEKANRIITAQSLDVPLQTAPISLSELYNYEAPSFVMTRKTVGF